MLIYFAPLTSCSLDGIKNKFNKDSQALDTSMPDEEVIKECGYELGDIACNFTGRDQFNNIINLEDNYGDVVVLDFSTMWCGYCQVSAPIGNEIYLEYKDQGFNWITLLIEDSSGEVPNIYDQQFWAGYFELDYPIVASSREIIDYNSEEGYSLTSWPTFMVLDRDLRISYIQKGWGEPAIRNEVEEYLY